MSGGPGASSLFPSGQERQNHQPHWGVYADATSLPNAAGNILVAGKFENLAVGHLAYSTADAATYQCTAVGTVGVGDATWTPVVGGAGPALNWVFVAKNGVDSPAADGSIAKPYLTIVYALAQIPTVGPTAPSPTNRWCVFVAAGRYNEVAAINLRANVMIFGSHFMATRIAAPAWGLDADFTPAGDHRSGVQNAAISGNCTFDFNAIASNEGKLYFQNVWLQSQVDFTAFSPIQQFFLDDVFTFASVNVNGGQLLTRNSEFQAILNFKIGPTLPSSVWIDDHSTYQAGRTIDLTGQGAETYQIEWYGSGDAGPTSITGTVAVKATSDSLPPLATLTLVGAASLVTNDVLIDTAHALDVVAAAPLRLGTIKATGFFIGKATSPAGTDPLVLINQDGAQIGGSNAGVQYSTTRANRAQVRGNQFGPNAAGPGITGYKSRGAAIGDVAGVNKIGVLDGDLLFRITAIGVARDDTSIPLAGLLSIQVPPGGSLPASNYVSTELELQLVPLEGPINGATVFFKVTSQGVPVLRETLARNAPLPPLAGAAAGLAVTGAGGTIVVANPNVKAGSRITLTIQPGGAAPTGAVWMSNINAGVDFTIQSMTLDVGVQVYWQLWEGI